MYFRIFQDSARQWRWHLKSANQEIIAQGESYHSKANCLHAIGLVMSTTTSTPVHEF